MTEAKQFIDTRPAKGKIVVETENKNPIQLRNGFISIFITRVALLPEFDKAPNQIEFFLQSQAELLKGFNHLATQDGRSLDLRYIARPANKEGSGPNKLEIVYVVRTVGDEEWQTEYSAIKLWEAFHQLYPAQSGIELKPLKPGNKEDEFQFHLQPWGESEASLVELVRLRRLNADYSEYPYFYPFTINERWQEGFLQQLTSHPLKSPVALCLGFKPTRFAWEAGGLSGRCREALDEFQAALEGRERRFGTDIRYLQDAITCYENIEEIYQPVSVRFRLASSSELPAGLVSSLASALTQPLPSDKLLEKGERKSYYRQAATGQLTENSFLDSDMEISPAGYKLPNVSVNWQHQLEDLEHDYNPQGLKPDQLNPGQMSRWLFSAEEAAKFFALPVLPRWGIPGIVSQPFRPFSNWMPQFQRSEQNQDKSAALPIGKLATSSRQFQLKAANSDSDFLKIPLNDLKRHALVVGMTGSGKTTTCLSLLHHLLDKVPFMVIEPVKGEYRTLITHQAFKGKIQLCIIGHPDFSLRWNPLAVLPGVPIGTHISYLKSCFMAAFPLYGYMQITLLTALENVYKKFGWSLTELAPRQSRKYYPTLMDLTKEVTDLIPQLGYSGEPATNLDASLRLRLKSLVSSENLLAYSFNTSSPFPLDFFNKNVVVDLTRLGDGDEKALLMAFLLTTVYEHFAYSGNSFDLRHVTLIEEAHRLLSKTGPAAQEGGDAKSKAVELFSNMLAEIRSFGAGLIIAEQMPSKLIEDAIKNTNLKIVHRMTPIDERTVLGNTMNAQEDQVQFITNLQQGEVVVFMEGLQEPLLVKPEKKVDLSQAHLPEEDLTKYLAVPPTTPPLLNACEFCQVKETSPHRQAVKKQLAQQLEQPTTDFDKHFNAWLTNPSQVQLQKSLFDEVQMVVEDIPIREPKEGLLSKHKNLIRGQQAYCYLAQRMERINLPENNGPEEIGERALLGQANRHGKLPEILASFGRTWPLQTSAQTAFPDPAQPEKAFPRTLRGCKTCPVRQSCPHGQHVRQFLMNNPLTSQEEKNQVNQFLLNSYSAHKFSGKFLTPGIYQLAQMAASNSKGTALYCTLTYIAAEHPEYPDYGKEVLDRFFARTAINIDKL